MLAALDILKKLKDDRSKTSIIDQDNLQILLELQKIPVGKNIVRINVYVGLLISLIISISANAS